MKKLIPGTFMEIPPELRPKYELANDQMAQARAFSDASSLTAWQIVEWYALAQKASDEQLSDTTIDWPFDECTKIVTGPYGPTFAVITVYRGKIRSIGQYMSSELPNALDTAHSLYLAFPKGHTYLHMSETQGEGEEGYLWIDGAIQPHPEKEIETDDATP